MARIDGLDADALGFEPQELEFSGPPDGGNGINRADVDIALESVFDPEIPVSIVALGLGYDGGIQDVERRVQQVPNVESVSVDLVFDPPWNRDMMSEEAQLELGLF